MSNIGHFELSRKFLQQVKYHLSYRTNLVNEDMGDMTSPQSQRIQLTSCTAGADNNAVVRSRVQLVRVCTVLRDGFWDILRPLNGI